MKKVSDELLDSGVKSIFGMVPGVGTLLNEFFFDYRLSLKQNRLNRFVEILGENLTADSEINLDNLKTEDFSDLFEAVLQKAIKTKSELKLQRFKNILIQELKNPSKNVELIDHYLDLISNLTEEEITVLYNHRHFTMEFEEKINRLNALKDKQNSLSQQLKKRTIVIGESEEDQALKVISKKLEEQKKHIDSFSKFRNADYYNLSENNFMFYKQRLFSKGLLIDNRMNRFGSTAFNNMGITEFGNEFIEFIKNSE